MRATKQFLNIIFSNICQMHKLHMSSCYQLRHKMKFDYILTPQNQEDYHYSLISQNLYQYDCVVLGSNFDDLLILPLLNLLSIFAVKKIILVIVL